MTVKSESMQRKPLRFALLFVFYLLVFAQCKKETSSTQAPSQIIYEPFGPGIYPTLVKNKTDQKLLVVLNERTLRQTNTDEFITNWSVDFDFPINALVNNKNGSTAVIETDNLFQFNEKIKVYNVDDNGYKNYITELMPNHHHLKQFLIGAQSDGNNGLYAITYLEDYKNPPQETRRFLVHLNNNQIVDQRIELTGFYMYISADEQGNIYLTKTFGPTGLGMQLKTGKVNMNQLITNGIIQMDWEYSFQSKEPDFKWTNYFPFKISVKANKLTILKQHNTGINDMSSGVDVLHIDANSGAELKTYFVPFDFEVNNYNNQSSFHYFNDRGNDFVAFNYGRKAKCVYFDQTANLLWQAYMSGDNSRSFVTGVGNLEGKMHVFGSSTLMKSPISKPYVYSINLVKYE